MRRLITSTSTRAAAEATPAPTPISGGATATCADDPTERTVGDGLRASTRDDWQQSLDSALRKEWQQSRPRERLAGSAPGDSLVVIAPAYGYFSALRFLLPGERRANIDRFVDAYTEAQARYPLAQLGIVAHSNGSFMLGEALRGIPTMSFDAVVVAGSVLPPDFPWDDLVRDERVGTVRNDAGATDWPVALLAGGVRGLGQRDVGTGGFDGFNGSVTEFCGWHEGGHGAAFSPGNYPLLARAALGETGTCGAIKSEPNMGLRMASRAVPWVAPVAMAGLLRWSVKNVVHRGRFDRWGAARVGFYLTLPAFVLDVI